MLRILTGIQPSGALHVGNYFGAMRPLIRMQERGQVFCILVDLHALTTLQDPDALRENTRSAALDFLAAGLDPQRSIFFKQSDVPEHAELMWILSTVTPMGLLERAHAYKDKVAKGIAPNAGLFVYPILQAADILLYDADVVPVGKDQKQHLEMARDMAVKVNEAFGEDTLKLPEPEIAEEVAVVPGIDGQKMSKSYGNTLNMFGEEKALRKRVMSIVTDSTPLEEPKPTEGSNILALYRLFASAEDVRRMEDDFRAGGIGYGDFKKRLFEAIMDHFGPMRARRAELERNPDYVDEVLRQGAERAREVAGVTMDRVRVAIGLR
ncbi:MAG TPA: tryptophan--tRNA ligase [Longimicrobiaceae bacterium]|nr:tryptophan--tRNA ligase [Longimicrobiaceae bacterium]